MHKKTLDDTNIAVKAGFTSMLVMMLLFGVFSLYQLKHISLTMTDTLATNSKKIVHVVLMRDAIRQRQIVMAEMLSMEDIFEREKTRILFFKLAGEFRKEVTKLKKLPVNKSEQIMLDRITESVVVAQGVTRQAVSLLMIDNTSEKGRKLVINAQILQKSIYGLLGDLISLQDENIQKSVKTSKEKYSVTLALSILFAIVIVFIAWLIAKKVTVIITSKNKELVIKNKHLNEASKKAQIATQAKSDFLAIMSHELRTPLTSIIGFAEALTERSTQIKDRIRITKIIIKSGKHLLTIINDILDISKVEANKMEFEKNFFSPIDLVMDIKELIGKQFIEKNILFNIEYIYPIPKVIHNDALRTKQIILNLCSNALKFTKMGNVIIKIHCDIENEKIFFTVADSGIGLTEKQISKVFDAFSQAEVTTTREYGGTGLGLSLSKQLAERMGGIITVTSSYGVGSQFCVCIATGKIDHSHLIKEEPAQPEKIDNISFNYDYTSSVKGRILIAEDNKDNQQLLTILLSDIGADICYVENGKEAIEQALEKPFELILMDMQMPIMGGLDAIKILRQSNYTNPIIVLTANAMSNNYEMCVDAGCDDFLTKPINKDKLFQAIYKHLEIVHDNVGEEEIVSDVFDKQNVRIRELIIRFIQCLPERMELIEKFKKEKNWAKVQKELHKIKGIGTSMGYPMLTEISAEFEYEAMRENEFEIDALFIKMKSMCERIVKSVPDITTETRSEV